MKKLYKINAPIAERQAINDGLIDQTVCVRVDYQQTMHATHTNTEVGDAFTKMQQDLTRLAKFKTNIKVHDLVYAFYFKLDIITDLLEFRRICRATTTRQDQKLDSARVLTGVLKGPNPLFYKCTYENITANKSNIINKWNELYRRVNSDLQLPRIEEFYRRAFYADSVFKDYSQFDRSPLIYFARKYTNNFAVDSDLGNVAMTQSTATTSGSELPLEVLDAIDQKITDYLDDDGNYIYGLLKKLSTAGVYKADSGFWQEWKYEDTVAINDSKEIENIMMNVWDTNEKPSAFTDEQVTNTFFGATGKCSIYLDTNLNHRANILAGKSFGHLKGKELCDALQFLNERSTAADYESNLNIVAGMFINNYSVYCYGTQFGLYHHDVIDDETKQTNLQYVSQKYLRLMPNAEVIFEKDMTPEGEEDPILADIPYIINQQGEWRFEFDSETLSAIVHAFIMSMILPEIKESSKEEK